MFLTKLKFPHPLVLLVYCVIIGAILSYIIPSGEFDRVENKETGRNVVVPGSYHAVDPHPMGFFQTMVAVPKGLTEGASVIFFVFLVGGAFVVVDKTGTLEVAFGRIASRFAEKGIWVIPITILFFATAGALENMQEEIIPLIPVLLLLTSRLGFDALTTVAISFGAAAIGSAFSPVNPFQVGIAQKLAELPLVSGGIFRLFFLLISLAGYSLWVIQRAKRNRVIPEQKSINENFEFAARHKIILALVILAFTTFIYGVMELGWEFEHMAAVFFMMGILAGLIGGLGTKGTATAFVEGFRSMAYAGLLIGFARAIFVVLDEGKIIDSIVYGLFYPLAEMPLIVSALLMTLMQSVIHFSVPSVSGQAVLTMPILVPLSDLLGMSRQVTVLCFQYGAGLAELIIPTNGAMMAIIASAGLSYPEWFKFAAKTYLIFILLGIISIFIAILLGV